jgi:hypothetical protein
MFENCYLYNGRTHQIAPFCQLFQDAFEEKFSKLKKAKEKAKFSIFDKLNSVEKTVRNDIAKHELILNDLRDKLEGIIQQRKFEQEKLNQLDGNYTPKEQPKKKIKPKSKPIKPVNEVVIKKASKKPQKVGEKLKKRSKPKPRPKMPSPPPQIETKTIEKSDSEEDDSAASMTYEEMRNLSMAINKLPQNLLGEVLNILKKYQPKETNAQQNNELEIDFQSLKPITLRELEKFVMSCNKPKPKPGAFIIVIF